MNEPLVSVIIPVYKVEQYLEQCLDSVINQTYRNLEIILIDDGSPDNCGAICDTYKAKDERIIVIHQENQGLSAARNAGLDICKGEYIAFVDSDDWVEENFVEKLMEFAAPDTLVCCGYYEHAEHRIKRIFAEQNGKYTSDNVVCAYIGSKKTLKFDFLGDTPWNKMYPREKFISFRYPLGLNHEDMYVILDVLKQASFVQFIPDSLYNYRIRAGSICRTPSKKNVFDILVAKMHQKEVLRDKPALARLVEASLVNDVIVVYKYALLGYYELNVAEKRELNLILGEYRSKVPSFSKVKLKLFLFDYCRPLLKLVYNLKQWLDQRRMLTQ